MSIEGHSADASVSNVQAGSTDEVVPAELVDALLSASPDHIYLYDLEGRHRFVNPSALVSLGVAHGDFVGRTAAEVGVYGDGVEGLQDDLHSVVVRPGTAHGVVSAQTVSGPRSFRYTVVPTRGPEGAVTGAVATMRDVTDHLRADQTLREAHESLEARVSERTAELVRANEELRRAERARAALSLSNKTLVRATDELQLMQDVCDAVVNLGGYRMVWVGLMQHDGSHRVLPMAWSGFEDNVLRENTITWDESPTGMGSVGRCIRAKAPSIIRDTETDDRFVWKEAVSARGYRSLIAFPLLGDDGAPFGSLAIYSGERDAFDDGEVALLEELSMDLAFGICSLRAREHQARTEEDLVSTNAQLEQMVYEVAEAMGKIVEARDPYTNGHEMRVARLGELIAREMGSSPEEVGAVAMAALLHDIGKLRIPTEILTKPGQLSGNEFALIKEHSRAGHEILADVSFPWPVAQIVLQHHERMDGSGYPNGIAGEAILPAARIIAVADVVEAMASFRPYRAALGCEAAIAEITERTDLYDPEAVAACVRLYRDGRLDFLCETAGVAS